MKRYEIAIILATGYLLVYLILFQAKAPFWTMALMLLLSPIPVLWMVYKILTAEYTGKELHAGEEFGYQDVDKNALGIF